MPASDQNLLDALEHVATMKQAATVLAEVDRSELGAAFCERVVDLAGRDPQGAARLARYAPAVLRAGGDPASVWRARAVGERCRGRWRQSASSFIRSADCATGPDALRLRVGVIDSLARGGHSSRAVAYGLALVARLEPVNAVQAARARLNVGNALLWQSRFAEAVEVLRAARSALQAEGAPLEAAAATLGLSTATLELGRWREGEELALEARNWFSEQDLAGYAALCDVNLGLAELGLGRPDAAFLRLDALLVQTRLAKPEEARVRELLGDACLELNLLDEAVGHYRGALHAHRTMDLRLDQADCAYGMGVALQRQGRPGAAHRQLRRAKDLYASLGNPLYAANAGIKAALVLPRKRRDEAHAECTRLAGVLLKGPNTRFAAEACLACATTAPPQRTRRWLLRAVRLAEAGGSHRVGARALALLAVQTPRRRLVLLRRAFDLLMLARGELSSVVALERFFEGSEDIVRAYLSALLDAPRPRVREALDAVRRTTAAALLDDFVTARRSELPDDVLRQLDDARRTPDDLPGIARRAVGAPHVVGLDRLLGRAAQPTMDVPREHPDVAVYASSTSALYKMERGRALRLPLGLDTLKSDLDWLLFDLQRPMLDREASPEKVEAALAHWATRLACPSGIVCPEPRLWPFPWQALPTGPSVALHPSAGGTGPSLPSNARVLVWRASGLAGAGVELDALRKHFGNVAVCSTVEEARSSLMGEFDLWYVATHGRTNERQPFLSYLDFGGERIYATEVIHSRFRIHAAILAACSTGRIASASSLEPDGWVRTALACGARACVASVWALDDVAASTTLVPALMALREGATLEAALEAGRRACRAVLPHPYFHSALGLYRGLGGIST